MHRSSRRGFILIPSLLFLFLFVVTVLFSPPSNAGQVKGPVYPTYTINWASVSSDPDDPPDSQDDEYGDCGCDLTTGECDGNCCCDPDCSSTEKDRFTTCLPEGPSASTLRTCERKDAIKDTNIPENAGITVLDTADDLFCVKEDNSPSKGYFFDEPDYLSASSVNEVVERNIYANFDENDETTAPTSSTTYKVGDPLVAFQIVGANTLLYNQGKMALPGADFGGECNGNFYVKYMENMGESPCNYRVSSSTTYTCTSYPKLSYEYWVDNIRIGKKPSTTISETADHITPTQGTWTYGDSWTVGAFASASASGANACDNVVKSVQYVITHDGAGQIVSAKVNIHADLVYKNRLSVTQQFSVIYILSGTTEAYAIVRSGNIGYVPGDVVLAGEKATSGTKTAITQYTDGLKVTGPGLDGTCVKENTPVHFGENTVISCSVALAAYSNLQTLCQSTPPVPTELQSLTSWYIGKFGASSNLNINHWLELTNPTSTSISATWDASNLRCVGLVTGLRLRFTKTVTGRLDNPQEIITGVSLEYVRDVVTYPGELYSTSWTLPVRISVEFVPQSSNPSLLTPSAPPILPRLPDDILYPFSANANFAVDTRSTGFAVCLLLALVVMFFL